MPKKILIIDDEVDVMKMLVYRLEAKGFEVSTAINGRTGIAIAKAIRPDLIILDYCLPDLNADRLSAKLKEHEDLKDIPIVLITASVDNIAKKAEECRAVGYIAKPIGPEELYKKIAEHTQP